MPLPELSIVLSQDGGCPDVSMATFDEKSAWADYHDIIKSADDVVDDEEAADMDEDDYTVIDGVNYRDADEYGDPHARIFGVKLSVREQSFGEFFQAVMSDLQTTHQWDDSYVAITPAACHDGRWIDMILNGYLTNQTPEATAAVIHENALTTPA